TDTTSPTNQTSNTNASSERTMCFLRLEGNQNQDSTYVYMHIKADTVSGIYNWMPYMKDARRGTINGTIDQDTINVVWSYMQEGMVDSIQTKFLIINDQLKQQPFMTDNNGKQIQDRNAPFEIVYTPIGCPTL